MVLNTGWVQEVLNRFQVWQECQRMIKVRKGVERDVGDVREVQSFVGVVLDVRCYER